jgi:hypothetical protein
LSVTINRAVPNIRSDCPTETRDFFIKPVRLRGGDGHGLDRHCCIAGQLIVQVSIVGNDDPAAPGISVEVADVDAVHAKAVEQGLEIAYPLRDEEWACGASCFASRAARW